MIEIENISGTGNDVACAKVVIKLGSAVVMGPGGTIDLPVLQAIAASVAELKRHGVDTILVTSGSIGVGCEALGRARPKNLPDKQALAAIGQIILMHTYQRVLADQGLQSAQLLLTRGDMADRKKYLNARHTLERILELGAVPIVNENDTVSTEEISFGDNDELSAYVAAKMKADLLLLLSSVDGVHEGTTKTGKPKGELISVIEKIDDKVYGYASDAVGRDAAGHGTGGMKSKFDAARLATQAGVHTIIAGGKNPNIVNEIFTGTFRGTYFPANARGGISARARWIGFGRPAKGNRLTLDKGAVEALVHKKKSLLPVGVVKVEGKFATGDVVDIVDKKGNVIARGLANYAAEDADKIKGRKTSEIKAILGHRDYDAIVHRDNLVVL